MRKILVLRGGALGDFIVTLPALALLRRRWPAARIELVGNATAAQLVLTPHRHASRPPEVCHPLDDKPNPSSPRDANPLCHPLDDNTCVRPPPSRQSESHPTGGDAPEKIGLIDFVHSQHEARWLALYGTEILPPELTQWLSEFDLVLSYWPDPEGELARRFPLRDGQRFLSASAIPTQAPAAAHYCSPLLAIGLSTTGYFFPLQPSGSLAGNRIAIHPGSGSAKKNWPRERWDALAGWLREKFSAELLIIAGEAEAGVVPSFIRRGRVVFNRPPRELAAELARCRLFLGHDSGVSHLAAACGAPCVLLFGPTDPAMWAPPSPCVHVLRRGTELNSISLADVQRAVTSVLAARA